MSTCDVGLEFTREVSTHMVEGRSQGYRMRVEVTRYHNVDPNVFVYKVYGPDAETGTAYAKFDHIASPEELESLAIGAPEVGGSDDDFRLAEVDLLFASRDDLETTWDAIVSDQQELVRTLQYLCDLETDEVSAVGVFDDGSSSSME